MYLKKRKYEAPQRHCSTAGVSYINAAFSKRGLLSTFHWHSTHSTTPLRIYIDLSFAKYFTIINPQNTHLWRGGEGKIDYKTEDFK